MQGPWYPASQSVLSVLSFRLVAAADLSPGVPGRGSHRAEVPQLEGQASAQGYVLPEWRVQEVFPCEVELLHPTSQGQSQWDVLLLGKHRADAALVTACEHHCPRWAPWLFKELQALDRWGGQGLLMGFRRQSLRSV